MNIGKVSESLYGLEELLPVRWMDGMPVVPKGRIEALRARLQLENGQEVEATQTIKRLLEMPPSALHEGIKR